MESEVIDVDADSEVLCIGTRFAHDSPFANGIRAPPVTISLIDSDSGDEVPRPQQKSRSPAGLRRLADPPRTELQQITQSELSRRALRDGPSAIISRMLINHNKRKQKDPSPEIIEISSDSEPETLPFKRQKVDECVEPLHHPDNRPGEAGDTSVLEAEPSRARFPSPTPSDCCHSDSDDDDCLDFLAALDISNEANWAPLPERNKAEDLTPMHESGTKLCKSQPLPSSHLPRKKPPVDRSRVPLDWDSIGPWGMISKNCGITKFPKPFHHARRQDRLFLRRSPNLYYEKGYTKLQLTAKYPHLTSGSVNKIIQSQDAVILCATVTGGLDDDDDDDDDDRPPPPPENKLGSLVVYHNGRMHMAPAHCHPFKTPHGSTMKYYTVNDIVFNPSNPKQFLSSGCDLVVQAWEVLDHHDNDERKGLNAIRQIIFDSRPQDLLYSPDGSALAITCYDGIVRLYSQDFFDDMIDAEFPHKKLCAAPRGCGHATGSTLWGKGPSKHLLFTSSEPWDSKNDFSGFHHAFDTCRGSQVVQFDATESGDAATISPDGTTLVLFTWGEDKVHPVRLYDVRRKEKMAYETEELEKFQVRPSSDSSREPSDVEEVNQASFSPDGRLLAVARNDNALHIYDVRALSRGPLCQFTHHDSDTLRGGEFGVVGVHWVEGRDRIGIMSGGDDGCVRLWEPALGNTDDAQGAVIGRTDFDVGHFSIGDRQDRELPLVIGDSGGGVHTYDFTNEGGVQI